MISVNREEVYNDTLANKAIIVEVGKLVLEIEEKVTQVPYEYHYYENYPDVVFLKQDNKYHVILIPITHLETVDITAVHMDKLMSLSKNPEYLPIVDGPTLEVVSEYSEIYKASIATEIEAQNAENENIETANTITVECGDKTITCELIEVIDNVYGATIDYLYVKDFPDIIFLCHNSEVVGCLTVDGGIELKELPEDTVVGIQKSRYMAYALNLSKDRADMLISVDSVSGAITKNSSIFADISKPSNNELNTCTDVFISDIEGHVYAKEIQAVVNAGVINVNKDGQYKPDVHVTRGQVAVIVARILNLIKS